ncbi:MAG: PKD domain-containing protein, partial [candidate division WOR-3 bacterium]
ETGGGLGAGLGFKVEILKWGLVEFNYTFLDYKKPFGQISSSPPNTPAVPSGPDSGSAGMSYTFSSSTTDPEGDNIAIRFAWGDGDTSSWSSYVPSGSTVSIAHAWTSSGTYNVKAQAKDINGLTSDWSSPHLITISSGNTVFYETFNNDPVGGNPNPNVWTVVESLPSYVEIVANGYSNNGLIFVDPTADTIPGGDSSCAWIVKSGLGTYTNIEFYVKSQSSNLHWGIRAVNEWFNYSTISWYLWFLGNGVYYAPQGHQPDSAGFVFIDNIAPNTWHKFRLVLNWGTKTYLIYIDDVLKATAPFVYNVSGGAYLQLVDFYSSWLPIDGLIVDEINLTNTFGMTVPTIRTKLPDSFNKVVGAQ